MSALTREQVLERVAGLGPLQNVFLIGQDTDALGGIAVWYPEIGLREFIFEKDDLALAIYGFLREAGVRRFHSWEHLREAQRREKWEGWDTSEDFRRMQQAMEELARIGKPSSAPNTPGDRMLTSLAFPVPPSGVARPDAAARPATWITRRRKARPT